jgi:hypothetical protein
VGFRDERRDTFARHNDTFIVAPAVLRHVHAYQGSDGCERCLRSSAVRYSTKPARVSAGLVSAPPCLICFCTHSIEMAGWGTGGDCASPPGGTSRTTPCGFACSFDTFRADGHCWRHGTSWTSVPGSRGCRSRRGYTDQFCEIGGVVFHKTTFLRGGWAVPSASGFMQSSRLETRVY